MSAKNVPTITLEKIATLEQWAETALKDSEITTDSIYKAYYAGTANGLANALRLIHEPIAEIVKSNRGSKTLVVVAVLGGLYLVDRQFKRQYKLKEKAKK